MNVQEIMQTYPTRVDYLKQECGNVSVLRICCQQSNKEAFDSVRGTELSVGSSSVAQVIGLGKGKPKDFLNYKRQCLMDKNYAYQEQQAILQSKGDPLLKGETLEPLSSVIYEQLTGFQVYDGEFLKLKRDYPPSEIASLLGEYEYDLYNNSSDGVVLLDNVAPVASQDEIELSKTTTIFRLTFSQAMHPLSIVSHGLEIKNTFFRPCDSLPTIHNHSSSDVMKIDHIVQCQFQCWALGVEYVDYISTFFEWPIKIADSDDPTLDHSKARLKHVFLVRVHRSNEFIKEMLDRISKYHCAMLTEQPDLPYGSYDIQIFLDQCHLEVIFNISEADIASFDLAQIYNVEPYPKRLW